MPDPVSIVLGLFARPLIKSLGDTAFNGASLLESLKKELTTSTSSETPNLLKAAVDRLNLKKTSRERLIKSGSIIDLAGIAWAELLSEQPDSLVTQCTEESSASELARRLHPHWFIEAITSPRATEVTFPIESSTPSNPLNQETLNKIASIISIEVKDELQLDDSINPDPLIKTIINRLPSRIHDLWVSIPGIESKITRSTVEATHKIVSGRADQEHTIQEFRAIAKNTISQLDKDVFGRIEAQPNEPPILLHRDTYIEPAALIRKAQSTQAAKGTDSVKNQIRWAWESNPQTQLIVVHAPFGYGKSLTFKDFAADLARQWQAAPDETPFPILLRCPDILSGHVATLKAAVQHSLEKQTDLTPSTIDRIWSTHKLILLLDSFDEVRMSDNEARGWIEEMQQLSNGDRVRIIVASRPHAFNSKWLTSRDWEIELLPFDEERGQRWLTSVAGKIGPKDLTFEAIASKLDQDLAGTPILLVMAAYGWTESLSDAPRSKATIYRRFIEKISTGKWKDVQEAHQVVLSGINALAESGESTAFRKALQLLAWQYLLMEQFHHDPDSIGLTKRQISDTLQTNFAGIGDDQIEAITKSLCLSLFLHKSASTESVVFTHRSFREYLCAEYVVDMLLTKRTGSHYLSPAWRTLAEATLGDAEFAFFGELLREHETQDRLSIAKQLDDWFSERRSIFFKGKNGLQIEKADQDIEVALVFPHLDRSTAFRFNAERLGAAARGVEFTDALEDIQMFGLDRGIRHQPDFNDYRVTYTISSQGPGLHWAFGYQISTGSIVAVSPIQDLEFYRKHLESPESPLAPIVHIDKKYFVTAFPKMRPELYFQSRKTTRYMRNLVELGAALSLAWKLNIPIPQFALHHPVHTPSGVAICFCSPREAGDTRAWWIRYALDTVAQVISQIITNPSFTTADDRSDLLNTATREITSLYSWRESSWEQLIQSLASIISNLEQLAIVYKVEEV